MQLDMECRISDSNGISLRELQEALSTGEITGNNRAKGDYLARLEKRLERIRGWQGPYSQIEFSPQIKAILAGKTISVNQDSESTVKETSEPHKKSSSEKMVS